jgi:hypothetical protein
MEKKPIFYIEKDESEERKFNHLLDWMNNPNIPTINLTVYVYYSYQKIYHRIYLQARLIKNNTRIILNDIIDVLETYSDIKLDNHSISYYIPSEGENYNNQDNLETYFYIGKYPLDDTYLIEIPQDGILKIKLRPIIDKRNLLRFELYEDENEAYNNNVDLDEVKKNYHVNLKSKRAKERTIGEIIKKVFLWKKIYQGIPDENGNKKKLTLQQAAEEVNLSKKSLDEYLNQLLLGKQYGFNFNAHKNDKVGILRGYVKKQQNKEKENNDNKLKTQKNKNKNNKKNKK